MKKNGFQTDLYPLSLPFLWVGTTLACAHCLCISTYKRIKYTFNLMRQSVCLVLNPNTVDYHAPFFNCTCISVGRASDSIMAATKSSSF